MPTTSASLYEQLFPLTTVMKQRFVENFSGDSLDERWNTTLSGSGAVSMNDAVDGGVLLDASATSGGAAQINFNLKKQFSHNSSKLIYVAKINQVGTNSFESYSGLSTINTMGAGQGSFTYVIHTNANWQLATSGGSWTFTASTITAVSDTYNVFEHILGASSVILKVDNVTAVTNTTNLPTVALQPMFGINTSSANSKKMNVNYCEAYNT